MSRGVVDEIALVDRTHDTAVCVKGEFKKRKDYCGRNPASYYQVIFLCAVVLFIIIACAVCQTFLHTKFIQWQRTHDASEEEYHRDLVKEVNSMNLTWRAQYNRWATRSYPDHSDDSDTKTLLKHFYPKHLLEDTESHIRELQKINVTIPKTFDARTNWPLCWSVHQVHNQGGCGSCWAVAAAAVMSDRLCISTGKQTQISALDLTSCCVACGGCQGTHWALSAFSYWKEQGVVSGGVFGSHEGCRPYSLEPDCGAPCSSHQYSRERTPTCERKCRSESGIVYHEDLVRSRTAYWIKASFGSEEFTIVKKEIEKLTGPRAEEVLQKELLLNGPVLACFTLFEDFQHYRSGIYSSRHTSSMPLYGHCAKLTGWGEESGVKYWTYSNTWGRDWGENGFFRIAFSEVPEEVVAGLI